jgi:hypothetical protein
MAGRVSGWEGEVVRQARNSKCRVRNGYRSLTDSLTRTTVAGAKPQGQNIGQDGHFLPNGRTCTRIAVSFVRTPFQSHPAICRTPN